jgi:lipopolysaccharide export system protein LptA
MKAAADLAVHDETAGTLLLTPAKGAKKGPWVDDGTVHVDAMWIQVDLATHDLRAKGKIQAKMMQGKAASGAATHTPALFEADQPVYGTGTALSYVSASRAASFTGDAASPANVYQTDGKNKIRATQRIDVQQESGNLKAAGDVESIFLLDSSTDEPAPGATAKPAKAGGDSTSGNTVVKAREMTYVDAERRATYTGDPAKPATLKGPDADMAGRQIVMMLQRDARALQTLEGSGDVFAKFDGGREALGDKLVYDAITKEHVITGKPMYFKNVQNDSGQNSCSLEKSTELHYEGKGQTIEEPGSVPKALRTSVKMPCDKPLKTFIQTLAAPAVK